MKKLTVFEVTDLLCAEGIPGRLLTVLLVWRILLVQCVYMHVYV